LRPKKSVSATGAFIVMTKNGRRFGLTRGFRRVGAKTQAQNSTGGTFSRGAGQV
jgi:hypothetical protein